MRTLEDKQLDRDAEAAVNAELISVYCQVTVRFPLRIVQPKLGGIPMKVCDIERDIDGDQYQENMRHDDLARMDAQRWRIVVPDGFELGEAMVVEDF